MSSDFGRRCVAWALAKLGRSYVWGGNGTVMWTKHGMKPTIDVAHVTEAYDCAGLVKAAAHACGGTDLRAQWNAQTMFDRLGPPSLAEDFVLRLYGKNAQAISHVAFDLGKGLRLEAAGGDQTTLTLADALNRKGAFVRIGFETRNDLIAIRSLSALEKAKP
jgi:cell wall-associated NlpC family hydrolase